MNHIVWLVAGNSAREMRAMPLIEVDKGVRIFVEDLNPRGNKTVVLVHGWPVNHRMYEYQTSILPKCGFRCVSIDVRGFGQSDKPWRGYTYDRLADDLYEVIRCMGLYDFSLVGFSMGGPIAIRYMSRHSGYGVKKLVLLDAAAPQFTRSSSFPYGITKQQLTDQFIKPLFSDRPQVLTNFGKMFFASHITRSFSEWFQDLGLAASGYGTIKALEMLRDEVVWDDLRHIHVPTGIFQGLLDKVVPPECAMALHKHIKGSQLFFFKHSGHAVFYDELKLFNRKFIQFLTEGHST